MMTTELARFLDAWDYEAKKTVKLLKSLPATQYDFRPDPQGRSLGELAWHLAEVEAYMSHGLETGKFDFGVKPPHIERPRTIEALAPGYERVHAEAVARIRGLKADALARKVPFFGGTDMMVDDVLWRALYSHLIHHRGQLTLMCRLAGGKPPGLFGPSREEMAAMQRQS